MRQKLIISENEYRNIRKMYGLINEEIGPEGGTSAVENFYAPGYYTTDAVDQVTNGPIKDKVKTELDKAIPFLSKNPNSIVQVTFESQESAIPNTDNEGKENQTGTRLDVGTLSDYRKKYIELYVNAYIKGLKDNGVIPPEVEVPEVVHNKKEPVTPWVGTPFCKDGSTDDQQRSVCVRAYRNCMKTTCKDYKDKYDTEQNSKVSITVKIKDEPEEEVTINDGCATNLKIRIYVPRHNCQNAEFFVFANNTLLYNTKGGMTANLNNTTSSRGIPRVQSEPEFPAECLNPGYGWLPNGDGTLGKYTYGTPDGEGDRGAGRSDTFIINEEQSKEIVTNGNGKINLWMIATTSTAHDDIPVVVIEKDGQEVYNAKPKFTQGRLLTLNACGTEVLEEGTSDEVPDVSSYITLLKTQKMEVLSKLNGGKELTDKQKKRLAKTGINIDQKGLMLERADEFLNKVKELANNLTTTAKLNNCQSTTQTTDEMKQSLSQIISGGYQDLYNMIISDVDGQPTFYRDPSEEAFENDFIDGDDLAGDLRMRLIPAMNIFDKIYYSTTKKEYLPQGSSNNSFTVALKACNQYNKEFKTKI